MAEAQEQSFPPQHQNAMPASEAAMMPHPEFEDREWQPRGDLAGKVALVTGGDSGIGRAVAILFAKEGADVVVAYLNEDDDARVTADRVRELGRRCELAPGDLADPAHASAVADRVRKVFGRLDVLVDNASVQFVNEDFTNAPVEQLRTTLESNLLATMVLTQRCLPLMSQGAAVIVTTSVTAFRGSGHLVAYSVTKGGLLAFVRSLSQQLLESGIRVNGVAPGPIWTPLIPGSFTAEDVATFGQQAPMKRAGQPREVAPCYLFLACDRYSSYMSGQILHPNGGEIVA